MRKKTPIFCHSERSEESLFLFVRVHRREIPRSARNDKINYFSRSLFTLWVLVLARTNPHRLKSLGGNYRIFVGHGFSRAVTYVE
jgi:hypothetical protein